ncbi:MAG: hypothetical protein AAFY63_23920 [Cyanobacteria bacterium J06643_13]
MKLSTLVLSTLLTLTVATSAEAGIPFFKKFHGNASQHKVHHQRRHHSNHGHRNHHRPHHANHNRHRRHHSQVHHQKPYTENVHGNHGDRQLRYYY